MLWTPFTEKDPDSHIEVRKLSLHFYSSSESTGDCVSTALAHESKLLLVAMAMYVYDDMLLRCRTHLRAVLFSLEPAVLEFKLAAVLGDDAHDLIRCTIRDGCFNLQG